MDQDEELYLQATQEVEDEIIDAALWAKSMAIAEGDTKIVKYKYIKLRVEQFKQLPEKEEEKWGREKSVASEMPQQKESVASEKILQAERLESERIQQQERLENEKRLVREKLLREERVKIEKIRQQRKREDERIQQEESEIISGLSELGCEMKHRLFGGWMIREPLGGVINVKTIDEANEYYKNKKPASM